MTIHAMPFIHSSTIEERTGTLRLIDFPPQEMILCEMSNKDIVRDLLEKLPDEASLADIAQEIEFIAGVGQWIDDLHQGRTLAAEQLRERLRSWTASK